ncbi:MAG TPA: leucyl aminopeptidase [Candidatus Krumholzibacteria bacterium]|nr:leucyl aminopeptidase [Candidatus Krumholzibacteria bacterium]
MRFSVAATAPVRTAADLLVVPVLQVRDQPDLGPLWEAADGRLRSLRDAVKGAAFLAKAESLLGLPVPGTKAGWVLLVGLGPREKIGLESLRRAAAAAAREARRLKAARVAVAVPAEGAVAFDDAAFARCWAEGSGMALSPVGVMKTGPRNDKQPDRITLLADEGRARELKRGLAEAEANLAGCLFARDLVNLPPNVLTPVELANRARRMARAEGFRCTVLGPAQMAKLKMGGILGVGQGSANPPRLIVLEKRARSGARAPKVALVGKGITFDTGGISLKPSAGMELMKTDMGGAAAVLGAALVASRLRLDVNLTVVVPTAENMPDGRAGRPSDIITMASGKTVEVLNTDAEGRLILADALWYAGRRKPDVIIDAATLTGACAVALGSCFAGMMGNSAQVMDALTQAGGETHERVWPLPLVDEHKEEVEGTWSDLKNLGRGREGGALSAAAFLAHFVGDDTAWAHLDIAGTAWTDGPTPTCPRGATGFGARLIARALEILAD